MTDFAAMRKRAERLIAGPWQQVKGKQLMWTENEQLVDMAKQLHNDVPQALDAINDLAAALREVAKEKRSRGSAGWCLYCGTWPHQAGCEQVNARATLAKWGLSDE